MADFRRLKARLQSMLSQDDWQQQLEKILEMESSKVVGPLFSFLLRNEIKWRAVTALGTVIARLADERMEEARIIMRRCMWHMNEESGNIGWGIPETMGEAMALHPKTAEEYHTILISYIQDSKGPDNYLDHPPLRRAAVWGVGRLAEVRPEQAAKAEDALLELLDNQEDPPTRGHAARALGLIGSTKAVSELRKLVDDDAELELFRNRKLENTTVGALSREALQRIQG